MQKTTLGVLAVSFAYALARYSVFGPVPWEQMPVYLLNKALAVSSVMFVLLAARNFAKRRRKDSAAHGRLAVHTALVHTVLSLAILSPSYFPKFFGRDQLNTAGGLVVLAGTLALYLFHTIKRHSPDSLEFLWIKLAACVLLAVHVVAMGFSGWLTPEKWHGGLPPISLLSFLIIVAGGTFYALCLLKGVTRAQRRTKAG